jgi:hypothetical protein
MSVNANAKCVTLTGIFVQQKFSNGEYLIQYRNGWAGLGYGSQRPKYDLAVLRLIKGGFEKTGQYHGRVQVVETEKTTITVDGFDRKVPLFKEVVSCN